MMNRVIEEQNNSGRTLKQFIYGNVIDELLRMDNYTTDGSSIKNSYYFHSNDIGSITALSNENGEIVEDSILGNPYMFHGRRFDKKLNLMSEKFHLGL